jgi:hypothetical protein
VTDERQHGEHCLHQHALLPLAALTEFEVGGVAFRRMEGSITQRLSGNFPAPLFSFQAAFWR